ncbi:MAG: hypothetical protein OXG29_08360, partial [Gammaproteobacteria bacterium]|nr:hypothetical protein [Gammaproteobacteria bacterium]
ANRLKYPPYPPIRRVKFRLGPVTVVNLGEINRGNVLRTVVLDQKFGTVGSAFRNENGRLVCGDKTCDVVVLRQLLRLR